ncbi:hypothetical protein D3C80_1530300 [compost metagenome]
MAAFQRGFPLLIAQCDIRPEVFLPHRSRSDRLLFVLIRGVVQQRELQGICRSETGLRQQFLRFGITLLLAPARPFRRGEPGAIGKGWGEVVRRDLALAHDFVGDDVAIER